MFERKYNNTVNPFKLVDPFLLSWSNTVTLYLCNNTPPPFTAYRGYSLQQINPAIPFSIPHTTLEDTLAFEFGEICKYPRNPR